MRTQRSLELDERLWEAVQRAAAEDGVPEGQLVEEALRRYIGLRGIALLDDIAGRQGHAGLSDEEAMTLAVAEIRAARAERGRAGEA
jgi:hypothetical protein